jgi:hypothetical protein
MQGGNAPVETPLPAQAVGEVQSRTALIGFGVLLPSVSRGVGSSTTDTIKNHNNPGVRLYIDVVSVGGAGTVTVKIQNQDPASKNWLDLAGAVTTALAAIGTSILEVYPGITAAANVRLSDHLGLTWRVVGTVAGNAVQYSVGAEYLK